MKIVHASNSVEQNPYCEGESYLASEEITTRACQGQGPENIMYLKYLFHLS
jgi:hypothetical protein